ncbi:MAG: hypothetical protein EON90_11310 [Brevundimonas sp.]|nr:MAG: hypothetical protein EON90_11310 [Brevundimonas sp.]
MNSHDKVEAARPTSARPGGLIFVGLVAVSIWLAWQIGLQPFVQRLPPVVALRVAPQSAELLGKAAEEEWSRDNYDAAERLAEQSVRRAPFSVRAVRVLGLAKARSGDGDSGEQLVTLAGNWSLRDDPAHAWLMVEGLKRGNYATGFAHADALLRRRGDLQKDLFPVLTKAAIAEPAALRQLGVLIAASPPWRRSYLAGVLGTPEGMGLSATLAVALRRSAHPFQDVELTELYVNLDNSGQAGIMRSVRDTLEPQASGKVFDGGFESGRTLGPLGWTIHSAPGVTVEVVRDDDGPRGAVLHVIYDGYSGGTFVDQTLLLPQGRYVFTGLTSVERAGETPVLGWELICVGSSEPLASVRPTSDLPGKWVRFSAAVTVPSGCERQRLVLKGDLGDRRQTIIHKFDDLSVTPRG